MTYDDLLRGFKKMHGQQTDPLTLRRELETRKWTVEETFTEYLHDKVMLFNLRVSISEIISYIIDGIPSEKIHT